MNPADSALVIPVPMSSGEPNPSVRRVLIPSKPSSKGRIKVQPIFQLDESKPNPLKNDVVLRNIMSYLAVKDLKSCRLTSQEFNKHATYFFRKKHPAVKLVNSRASGNFVKLKYGMKDVDSTFPFRSFLLSNLLTERIALHVEDFGRFIRVLNLEVTTSKHQLGFSPVVINFHNALRLLLLTPNVEDLTFMNVSFANIGSGETPELPTVPLVLSKLKRLCISTQFDNLVLVDQSNLISKFQVVTVIHHLLSLGANNGYLEEIKLKVNPLSNNATEGIYRAFFTGISEITSLKKLTIQTIHMQDGWFEWLINPTNTGTSAALRELVLDISMYEISLTGWNWITMLKLIQHHRNSLEILQLVIPEFGPNSPQLVLPLLSKLKMLHLFRSPGSFFMNPITPLGISIGFQEWPQLNTISLPYSFLHSFFHATLDNPNHSFSSVQTMKVIMSHHLAFNDPIPGLEPKLFKVFPNLKELEIEIQENGPMVLTLINKLFANVANPDDIRIEILGIRVCGSPPGHTDSPSFINTLLLGKQTPGWVLRLFADYGNKNRNVYKELIDGFHNVDSSIFISLKRLRQLTIQAHEVDPINDISAHFTLSFLQPLEKLIIRNTCITPYYRAMITSIHAKVEFLGREWDTYPAAMHLG